MTREELAIAAAIRDALEDIVKRLLELTDAVSAVAKAIEQASEEMRNG